MRVLLVSLCLVLRSRVFCETTLKPEPTAPVSSAEQERELPTICNRCKCSNREVSCNGRAKLVDLARLQVPAGYNKLVLSNNQLTALHNSSFASGSDVTEIDLTYNAIRSVANSTFSAFKNLKTLCLAHNSLAKLEDNSFAGLGQLEKLDISQNMFKRISPTYFENLVNLRVLILGQNSLEHLHGQIFRRNPKLSHLFMNKVGVSELEEDLFQYTGNLRVLHLEDNFLKEVPRKALWKLPMLEVLYLGGNPIHVIAAMSFPPMPNLQQLVFDNMYNLNLIDMCGFAGLPMLRNLKIQHCRNLVYIDPQAFLQPRHSEERDYPQLKHLVLHDTAISTLSEGLLNWSNVENVDLSMNPFHCNCNLSWFVEFVKKHDVNENVRCSSPEALEGQIIGRMQPHKMLCDDYNLMKGGEDSPPYYQKTSMNTESRKFSLLYLSVSVMLTVTVALSVMLVISVKRRGFIYRKLGSKTTPAHAAGENVLYLQTTVDR